MNQEWNAQQYADNVRFVSELGQGVMDWLAPKAGERVLDLGCGDGVLTAQLRDLGCQVIGIDASEAMVEATRRLGLEAHVLSGEALAFESEFDAVFSNAALHWMKQPRKVIAGVWRALRPGGRFVAEFGGGHNVKTVITAIASGLAARQIDAQAVSPWYFPEPEAYQTLLEDQGFKVREITLFERPTPLPGHLKAWLETFAQSFTKTLPEAEQAVFLDEVCDRVGSQLHTDDGWFVDYVRLRFAAERPL